MNLAQIRTIVRDSLSAGGGLNASFIADDFWSDGEIDYYINEAKDALYSTIQITNGDYFTRILASSDPAITVLGRTYDPVSFQMTQGVGSYILPPDFSRLLALYDARTQNRVWFRGSGLNKLELREIMQVETSSGSEYGPLLFDILNQRTLLVRTLPKETFDVILIYERLLPNISDYSTGTVSVTHGSAVVTFAGADLTYQFQPGDELIVGVSGSTVVADPNIVYPVIKTVTPPNDVVLDGPYTGVTGSTLPYIRSRAFDFPSNHHYALAYGAIVHGFSKGTNPNPTAVNLFEPKYRMAERKIIATLERRQTQDHETADAYLEETIG